MSIIGIIIDSARAISIECIALFDAFCLSFAPMYRDMREFAPAPNPFPIPPIMINIGATNPIAASGSAPSPATHTLSTMLYIMFSTSVNIIGHAMVFSATFGSPRITSTLVVSSFSF